MTVIWCTFKIHLMAREGSCVNGDIIKYTDNKCIKLNGVKFDYDWKFLAQFYYGCDFFQNSSALGKIDFSVIITKRTVQFYPRLNFSLAFWYAGECNHMLVKSLFLETFMGFIIIERKIFNISKVSLHVVGGVGRPLYHPASHL